MTKLLPTITTKQQEILKLLYRYRFLNRTQIQVLLKHKDKRRIISWLKDLRDKQYVAWHYNATDFIAKSRPAIYYLVLNGIRYLREVGECPSEELQKRYKEPDRTQVFIDRCLLIADCCIAFQAKGGSSSALSYTFVLPADYTDPGSKYSYLNELKPHLYVIKEQNNATTNYLIEYFESTLPRYQLRKRLKDYLEHIAYDWDEANGPSPIVLFICASIAELLYVKRRLKKLLQEEFFDEELAVRVSTVDKVKALGAAAKIWEDVAPE